MIRVDKALSQMQLASRTESRKMVRAGRVSINGNVVKSASEKFDETEDVLAIDGKQVVYTAYEYYMLNKPSGCVTATKDAKEKTVMDYLPKDRHRDVVPVGRLDKDTVGLLLLTNDGMLNHNLLAPNKHVEKTYYAAVKGCVTEETVAQFAAGLDISEEKLTAPAKLQILSSGEESEVHVTITEGKFHQVKRMFAAVGMEVLYLQRTRMGNLRLDLSLKPGECRELSKEEVYGLYHPLPLLNDIDAVLFDLDGTLVDSMWVWSEIDREFFASHQLEFPASLNQDIEGMGFTETAEFFVEHFGLEESVEEIKALWNEMALEKYRTKVMPKPGAVAFLDDLKERGIRMGIATSNSMLLVETFLKAHHLEGYFDAITTACDVKKGKPSPEVYLVTAEKLNVDPQRCLVFEDILMGIRAGKNAGMRVCTIADDYSKEQWDEKQELADAAILDFNELLV